MLTGRRVLHSREADAKLQEVRVHLKMVLQKTAPEVGATNIEKTRRFQAPVVWIRIIHSIYIEEFSFN